MNGSKSFLRAVGSLWFAAVLLVLLLVGMAYATVFESLRGSEAALRTYYHAAWFRVLLALLAVNAVAALVLRFPFTKRQIGFVLTHAGILVTLGGALVTHYFGVDGQVGLADGQSTDHFNLTGQDAIAIWIGREQQQETLDLGDSLDRYNKPTDLSPAPTLAAGGLSVQVVRYLPDCEWQRQVLNDNPTPQP